MKKVLIPFWLFLISSLSVFSQTDITLAGVAYTVDTLQSFPVGPGTSYTALRYNGVKETTKPLRVFFLKIDMTTPNLKMEAVTSYDLLRGTELPTAMAKRKTKNGATFFAGINGDFYNTNTKPADRQLGLPINGYIGNNVMGDMPKSGRAGIGFVADNLPIIQRFAFKGSITAGSETEAINAFNTYPRADNSIVLYNLYNGDATSTDDTGTEVVVTVANDNWLISGAMEATVVEKNVNKGNTPIGKNQAVLSANGAKQAFLNKLSVGDKISLELTTYVPSDSNQAYSLSQWIGGAQYILKDGLWTGDEWQNAELHPRTAVGYTADKKFFYACVVDGRYNLSAGVNMQQLADMMLFYGVGEAVNLDGGGSSCMYVNGYDQVNHPSEGGQRAVSNGLFAVSTSPDDGNVSRIEFQDYKIELPIHSEFSAVVLGYNQYDVLIDTDMRSKVTMSCDPQIGTIKADGTFVANDKAATGLLTATYNGITATRNVVIKDMSDLKLRFNEILIDDEINYKIEVLSTLDGVEVSVDPKVISWTVDDNDICSVQQGVLRGLKNGVTTVKGTLGSFELPMKVTVEISEWKYYTQEDFTDLASFSVSASSNLKEFAASGKSSEADSVKVAYTFAPTANSTISFDKSMILYSIPDTVILSVNTGDVPFKRLGISFSLNNSKTQNFMYYDNPALGESVEMKVLVKDILKDQEDISSYPIKINNVTFYLDNLKHTVNSKYTFYIKDIRLAYAGKPDLVGIGNEIGNKVSNLTIYPNPVGKGEAIKVKLPESDNSSKIQVSIYSINGKLLDVKDRMADENIISIPTDKLPSGTYIIRIQSNNLNETSKVIVK